MPVCNKCGKLFNIFDSDLDFSIIHNELGYGTKYDGEALELHLCADCMDSIIDSCEISPVIQTKENPEVFLISGKARHGKDTTAQYLKEGLECLGKKVLVTHYGDLLKYICKNFYGWDGQKDENGRHILQHVGTDVIKKHDPLFWIDFVVRMLEYSKGSWDYVIIPDCRFPDEIEAITEAGFNAVHLRIVRDNFDNLLTEEQQNHPSETALDYTKPDFYIHNNGTEEQLRDIINEWIKENIHNDE